MNQQGGRGLHLLREVEFLAVVSLFSYILLSFVFLSHCSMVFNLLMYSMPSEARQPRVKLCTQLLHALICVLLYKGLLL